MVVYRDGEIFFGVFLADYILVQIFLYISGLGHFFEADRRSAEPLAVLLDDVVAQLDAFRADVDIVRPLYERISLASRPAAETADCL